MGELRQSRLPAIHPHFITAVHPWTGSGSINMPSKPNYNFQRAERDRAKKASKAMKVEERKKQAQLRKVSEAGGVEPTDQFPPDSGE